MLKAIPFALAVFNLLALPAFAQQVDEGVDSFVLPAFQGIAVAQAPEAGVGVCFGPEAADAISCAEQDCMAQSGLGIEDCAANLWCYPHGWVADIFAQHAEGAHWHKFICDQSSREELDLAVALFCDKDYLAACTVSRVWDPDGAEEPTEPAK
jgi:hypothetical protein